MCKRRSRKILLADSDTRTYMQYGSPSASPWRHCVPIRHSSIAHRILHNANRNYTSDAKAITSCMSAVYHLYVYRLLERARTHTPLSAQVTTHYAENANKREEIFSGAQHSLARTMHVGIKMCVRIYCHQFMCSIWIIFRVKFFM